MKPQILLAVLLTLTPCYAANNFSSTGTTTNSSTTPATPKYIDPVNGYMTLYDTNHDGKLDASELKKMSILDPAAYQIASAFVNSRGILGVDEISQWRLFLKAKSQTKTQNGSGS